MEGEKSCPKFLTTEGFRGLCARHGFSQAEAGSAQVLNDALVDLTAKLTKAAMLQAEHNKQTGLHGEHAKAAIEMTREIPRGIY